MTSFPSFPATVASSSAVPSAPPSPPPPLLIRELGSFHVGGHYLTLTDKPPRTRAVSRDVHSQPIEENGDIMIGQAYAQFVRLAAPRGRCPLLLCHGGGLTGALWEATPDGRSGWQTAFLKAGWDVVISDSVERGRASWAPYPGLAAPFFRTAQEVWEAFRFGPAGSWHREAEQRRQHAELRFPVLAFDAFMKQAVPRWAGNEARIQSGYDALLQRLGDCCLVAHSQGGHFAMKAAMAAPERVRAVVLLEAADAPDAATADASRLQRVPHLFLWGDYVQQSELWSRCQQHVRRWYEALKATGVTADWVELPALGVKGNTHVMMADSNSDDIAAIVCSWLTQQGLTVDA